MSAGSKEEWPNASLKSKCWGAMARQEEGVKATPGSAVWTRWGVPELLVAAAITVLSGMAVAALHRDEAQATKHQPGPVQIAPNCVAPDPHLQELLREHHRAVFIN